MTIETAKKFEQAFADKEYVAALLKMDPKEAQASLAAKGYEFSEEEIMEMGAEVKAAFEQASKGELSEGDLEAVAGGKGHVSSYAAGVAVGVVVGLAGFAIGVGACVW